MEINYNLGVVAIFAYLLGSVPFGLLIAKVKGIDLRKVGSGNIGATNVGRALGRKWAYLCFLLDALKGALPMIIAGLMIEKPASTSDLWLWLLVGCTSVAGHIYPIYVRFKGGKGVATSLGMVLGLWPYYTVCGVICFIIWLAAVLKWRYVSLASVVAASAFPIVLLIGILAVDKWNFIRLLPLIVVAVLMAALVVVRHRENIGRLKNGTENKIFEKK